MQARPKIGKFIVIALIVSLVLGACGGGTTGSTWFNLPSVKLVMNEDGTANLYGISLNQVILQPSMIQQLQTANIQRLEARAGYNGIHVYLNGEDMPYISWDAESTANLQEVLAALPAGTVPNSEQIAKYLPWLRKIGLGVKFDLPVAEGQSELAIDNWSGETSVEPETAETTIGPIVIASLVFDESGEAYVEGIAVSELEQMLGQALPLRLQADTMALIDAIGAETFTIATQPNGIDILLNEEPLPGIAYDSAYLGRVQYYADIFVTDPAMVVLINQLIPLLPGAEVTVVVSFTGEPVAETDLGSITLVVAEDGTMMLDSGIPLPSAELPADVVGKLQEANVQQLGVNLFEDGLAITSNGQPLPTLSFTDESLVTMAALVGSIAGVNPTLITEGLGVARGLGADVTLQLPVAEGAEPVEIPAEVDLTMKPADIGDINRPIIQLTAKYGDDGFTEIGGVSSQLLSMFGVSLPTLPPELMNTLEQEGISELGITTGSGVLDVTVDGNTALTVNYDEESLQTALELAAPFMGDSSPVSNPVLSKFIQEQILPSCPHPMSP